MSDATYLILRVHVDWVLVATEIPGVPVRSFLGPAFNHYFNEKTPKTFVAAVLFATGVYYILT
jgi:uncharacterized membrane protein YfcA